MMILCDWKSEIKTVYRDYQRKGNRSKFCEYDEK